MNISDRDGTTPLHIACTINNLQIVRFLISKGAKANSADRNGVPLHALAEGTVSGGVDGVSMNSSGG